MAPSPIILHGLRGKPDLDEPNFSPFVWKTKLDLRYLGVPFEEVNNTFAQINSTLADKCGRKTTVPTIEDGAEIVTDSWAIAEYLEEKYAKPAGKSLFLGSTEGRALCRFVNAYVVNVLSVETRLLGFGKVLGKIDAPSQAHIVQSRFGGDASRLAFFTDKSADPDTIATHTESVRKALAPLEAQLRGLVESGVCTDDALWIGGTRPSHADFSVYGFYAWNRLSSDLVEKAWHHADLPYIGKWLEGFKKHGLVKEGELY